MKNLLYLIFAISLAFSFNSCREDGEWESNGGQFGFKIERDNNFIEKSVGEANQLTFNIVPNYDFSALTTSFKFTTNLNGVLKLNGQVLTANQSYDFTSKDNVFEYVGNVSGEHLLKITVTNSKGATQTEEFSLKYGVSEFTHTFTGGTADIWQGDETLYQMKVVVGQGQPTTGYQIKFNSYSGTVKYNGVAVSLGQFYPINNIDNFSVLLATNTAGQGKLTYTIKNATVSKDYEIQQTIKPRQIVIESMNVSAINVLPNTAMSLTGIITKSPASSNTAIKYKTWISSATNNNLSGIQTTNNAYTNYALGSNGSFSVNFNAVAIGNYTLNIQAQDEYGNESTVKTFDIVVEDYVNFLGTQSAELLLAYTSKALIVQKGFNRNFEVKAGGSSTITNIKYQLDYDITAPNQPVQHKSYTYNETPSGSGVLNISGFFNTNNISTNTINFLNTNVINRTLKITATSSTGQTKEITVVPAFNGIPPL